MRILLTTRGSSGHVLPLAPLGHAALAAGHDVLVAAQRQHEANVVRTGLPFAPVGDPPAEEWMPLMADFARLDVDRANAAMIGEFFARIDTRAALPELRAIVAEYRPDVIMRESWEFTSTLVAEPLGIPVARVALGLASVDELTIALASPTLDELRAELGLAADPDGERLRGTPVLSAVPELLDDHEPRDRRAAASLLAGRRRRRIPSLPLADWWEDEDGPLVYVTFGSVTAAEHLPYYPELYARGDRGAGAARRAGARDARRGARSPRARPAAPARSRRALGSAGCDRTARLGDRHARRLRLDPRLSASRGATRRRTALQRRPVGERSSRPAGRGRHRTRRRSATAARFWGCRQRR